jgi:large subunit ribosomal protein L21
MYAIVKAGGQQFRVAENQVITVNKLDGEAGAKVVFEEVLMVGEGEGAKVGSPLVAGAKVEAEIIRQKRGAKISAFNFKAKKNVRKRWGHRQPLTDLKIVKISTGK